MVAKQASRSLTIEHCATDADCSGRFIRNEIHAGNLPAWRMGRHIRIEQEDWAQYKRQRMINLKSPVDRERGAA